MKETSVPRGKTTHAVSMLGIAVTPLTISELTDVVEHCIQTSQRQVIIGNHNLNSIRLYQRHEQMRTFYARADLSIIDGMPLIAHANLMGIPLRRDHRITMVDLLPHLFDTCQHRGWSVVFIGGTPHVVSAARKVLATTFPKLDFHAHHGYFNTTPGGRDNIASLDFIKDHDPHILLVGMGMPRQEKWIVQNVNQLSANVILPIGAGMDYIAGAIPTPPRWMGRVGLEWIYRLLSEPRRLYRRYLIEPWALVPLMFRDYFARIFCNPS